jgi:hypothetical protein
MSAGASTWLRLPLTISVIMGLPPRDLSSRLVARSERLSSNRDPLPRWGREEDNS